MHAPFDGMDVPTYRVRLLAILVKKPSWHHQKLVRVSAEYQMARIHCHNLWRMYPAYSKDVQFHSKLI